MRGLVVGGDGLHHRESADPDRLSAPGHAVSYELTDAGCRTLRKFGVDVAAVDRHRPAVRYCRDWSEQRHHLAGALGTALTDRLLELDWIRPGRRRRVVTLTDAGRDGLHDTFGVARDWDRST